ncbi:DUF3267 domain-containing protein [Bacillus seohaeanensis]|uniref:DUF3267 domain-containing protein n=1 Tax=Bacillus seohaeanensis TaxID=284580 RepID=A0ABW5RTP5_9BACI
MYPNYEEFKSLEWEEIKIPPIINIGVVSLMVISILIGQYFVSLIELFNLIKQIPLLILAIPLVVFVYIVLHEFIHGVLMKYYSGISPQYGFSGPFIFAKSEAIFNKNAYIIITLAPMIILGVISAVLIFIISGTGVWFALFVWVINLYASRGDLQAVLVLKGLPNTYSIKDEGDSLQLYKQIK